MGTMLFILYGFGFAPMLSISFVKKPASLSLIVHLMLSWTIFGVAALMLGPLSGMGGGDDKFPITISAICAILAGLWTLCIYLKNSVLK